MNWQAIITGTWEQVTSWMFLGFDFAWPATQKTLMTIWASVPNGVGTAVGAYFGTRHVTANIEKLSRKLNKKTMRKRTK